MVISIAKKSKSRSVPANECTRPNNPQHPRPRKKPAQDDQSQTSPQVTAFAA
jgi:hypothetical protein